MKGKTFCRLISLAALLFCALGLSLAGADYIRAIWELKLPIFARRVAGSGSGLRIYKGLGYRINVRGSYSPWGAPEGPAITDFYLLGQHVGGAQTMDIPQR